MMPNRDRQDVDEQGRCVASAYVDSTKAVLQATQQITVTDVMHEEKTQAVPLVFSLSDLQVLMNKRNGMSATETLEDIAHGRQTRDVFLQRQEAWIKQLVEEALSSSDAASAFSHVANCRLSAST